MKKIRLLIFILSGMCVLQSCLQEDTDVFGKSASERLNEAQKLYGDFLTNATNGWRLEYIAGNTNDKLRGAFNFLLKFEDGKVTASVDILALSDIDSDKDPYTKITSYYKLEQDMGVSLSFETYNSFLHYYNEQHGKYETYNGDYEFTIMEASKDLIVLRGKKYGNIMEMHRMPDNVKWEKYLEDVNKMTDMCAVYAGFEIKQKGETFAKGSPNSNHRFLFSTKEKGEKFGSNILYTQTGIKFVEVLNINGKQVQSFNWNDKEKQFVSVDDPEITVVPYLSSAYVYFNDYIGTYTMTYKSLGKTEEQSKKVTIELKKKNKTLVVKGITDFDVELNFNIRTGRISMLSQNLGKLPNGRVVGMVVWDVKQGVIDFSAGCGMVNSLNMKSFESGELKFSFVDNSVWGGGVANGFILYNFISSDGFVSGNRDGRYAGPGESSFSYLTLTKQ